MSIESMTLGVRGVGGQTVSPLTVTAGDGDVSLFCRGVSLYSSTVGVPAYLTVNPSATGEVIVILSEGQIFASAGPTAAMDIGFGETELRNMSVRGTDAVTVSLSGPSLFTASDSFIGVEGPGGNPLITHTGTGPEGEVNLISCIISPANTTDDIVQATSATTSVALRSAVVTQFGYTGQIVVNGGPVFSNFATSVDGAAVGVVGAGFEIRLQNSSQVQHDSTTVIGSQPLVAAMDDLVFDTTQVSGTVFGPGPFALGDDATIVVDATSPLTLTLPAISSRPRGKTYRIVVSSGSSNIEINPTGADTVDGNPSLTFTPGGPNASIALQSQSATDDWLLIQADPTAGAGSTIPVDTLTYVNPLNGNDGTGLAGDIAFPFQTVKAAVDASVSSLGSGSGNIGVVVSPGLYDENVIVDFGLSSGMRLGIFGEAGAVNIRNIEVSGPSTGGLGDQELFISDLCIGSRDLALTKPPLLIEEGSSPLNISMNNVNCFVGNGDVNVIQVGNGSGSGNIAISAEGGGAFAVDNVFGVSSSAIRLNAGTFRSNGFDLRGRDAPTLLLTDGTSYNDQGSLISQIDSASPLIQMTDPEISLNLNNTQLLPSSGSNIIESDSDTHEVTLNDVEVQLVGSTGIVNMFGGGIVNVTSAHIAQTGPLPIVGATTVNLDHDGTQVGYRSTTVLGNRDMSDAMTEVVQGVVQISPVFTGGNLALAPEESVLLVDNPVTPASISLPPRSSVPDGKTIRVVNSSSAGSSGITLSSSGADTINGAASVAVAAGTNDYVEVIAEAGAATSWRIIGVRP